VNDTDLAQLRTPERPGERIAHADHSTARQGEDAGSPALHREVVACPYDRKPRADHRGNRNKRRLQAVGMHHTGARSEQTLAKPPRRTEHGAKVARGRYDVHGEPEIPQPPFEGPVPQEDHPGNPRAVDLR
jgi:hypothetical protein